MMAIENEKCWMKDRCNHIDCNKFCMRLFKLDNLFNNALISMQQRKHTDLYIDKDGSDLEQFKQLKEIEDNIESFVSEGKCLYIHSIQCGNGKTSWALRMVESYFNKIWNKSELTCKALFINVPRFLLALKENISEKSDYVAHIKDNILTADVVIWDDIGTKAITTYESEHLFSYIDGRIGLGKSNIFTSNLSNDELHNVLGDRLYSRIVSLSTNVELHGSDKRGNNV